MIEDDKLDHDGRPIFCHFLNRELHDSVDAIFNTKRYLKHLQNLSIVHNQPLFCNVSQLFEVAADQDALTYEIHELTHQGMFFAHSEYSRIGEFLESRRELYEHDANRYPSYFEDIPKKLTSIRMDSLGTEGSTTGFIAKEILKWNSQDGDQAASKVVSTHDLTALAPHLSEIQNITNQRESHGMTIALFRELESLGTPSVDGGLRRLLSALYILHYCREFGAVRSWGLPTLQYFDEPEFTDASLNYSLLDVIVNVTALDSFLKNRKDYEIADRITHFYSAERFSFCLLVKSLSNALKASFLTGNNASTIQSRVRSAVWEIQVSAASCENSNVASTYPDALNIAGHRLQQIFHHLSNKHESFRIAMASQFENKQKILITTATDLEDKVMARVFEQEGIGKAIASYSGRSSIGCFGEHGNVLVYHVRSSAGSIGSSGSQATIIDAVAQTKADMIISAGICFGLNEGKQVLGDIATSSRVRLYEQQRIESRVNLFSGPNIVPRGDLSPAGVLLLDRTREARKTWTICKIHEGVFLSGEKLVDSKRFLKQLRKIEPEAIAGEMEGAGVSSVGDRQKKEWIVIKGICDWGYGKSKGMQDTAAQNAFLLVAKMIKSGSLNAVSLLNST